MRRKPSCCYKCPKRTATCHGTCETYAKERKENAENLENEIAKIKARDAIHTPTYERRKRHTILHRK